MKNNLFFSILVMMVFTIACEKSEIHKQSANDVKEITPRTDDCDDCPIDVCCCRISYVSESGASLEICGATGNRITDRPCAADPPGTDCPNVSGFYQGPFTISGAMGQTAQYFCVPENASFMVNAISGTVAVTVTCQNDPNPQALSATFVGGNRYFFETNGDCEVDTCPN